MSCCRLLLINGFSSFVNHLRVYVHIHLSWQIIGMIVLRARSIFGTFAMYKAEIIIYTVTYHAFMLCYRKPKANTRRGRRFREYASYSSTKRIGFTKTCFIAADVSFYIFIGIKNVNICTGGRVGREWLLHVTLGVGEDLICFFLFVFWAVCTELFCSFIVFKAFCICSGTVLQ